MDIFEIDTICPNSGGRSQDQYSGMSKYHRHTNFIVEPSISIGKQNGIYKSMKDAKWEIGWVYALTLT